MFEANFFEPLHRNAEIEIAFKIQNIIFKTFVFFFKKLESTTFFLQLLEHFQTYRKNLKFQIVWDILKKYAKGDSLMYLL